MRPLRRLWRSGRRRRTPAGLFGQADRLRRQGRYGEAAQLVARGLMADPASMTGHLLMAYLHAARRTIEPARQEFRWVLERDATHPRALLGLARIELEAGDLDGCREMLARALRAYPDFPEARALLEGLATRSPSAPPALRLDRLRIPATARALFAVGGDGALDAALPAPAAEPGRRLARALTLASATLGRAGLGRLRRGIVEHGDERNFVRADTTLTLVLTLPSTVSLTQGLLEVNRLWAAAQHELTVQKDEAAARAGTRRVS